MYFAKRIDEDVVFDSTVGFDTLAEAREVARQGDSLYSVIEERKGATVDEPLSGELVASYQV